jgi:hypothetical protein
MGNDTCQLLALTVMPGDGGVMYRCYAVLCSINQHIAACHPRTPTCTMPLASSSVTSVVWSGYKSMLIICHTLMSFAPALLTRVCRRR